MEIHKLNLGIAWAF